MRLACYTRITIILKRSLVLFRIIIPFATHTTKYHSNVSSMLFNLMINIYSTIVECVYKKKIPL